MKLRTPIVMLFAASFGAFSCAASAVFAQALSPQEALARFKVADGFEVQLFASEPDVRQPVTMTFDERGRLWVIQYLQYPNPAGLSPVEVDRYLRTKYDRVPEPPPHGPRGADRITILEDTDGDGRVDKTKDFVTGLNLASALAIGNDGVYVGQAPYLLFYPDRDHNDVPDGDPEVLLTGFGLEDAHAVVNSLQWGPDGWLYGAQGSTVTADIGGVGFQQGIWRYHPPTKRFELFSEGGGNTWGLDFDAAGNVIAGTNWGDAVCLHQVQGGYYVKGFSKHGPLHNPFTYGYFEHVKHKGHVGGHVTCGGIVYQGDAYPPRFRGKYIAANLLSNAIYWHTFTPAGSTFTSEFGGTLLETDDIWFRPIDCLTGPDGSVYVADWYDQRANHVIPVDDWDKSNGRIWKIVAKGTRPAAKFDLRALTSGQLVEVLSHPNAWQRREARRILADRRDEAVLPKLRELIDGDDDTLALEALWALYVSGGWNEPLAIELLDHRNADVRSWAVRLIGDESRELSRQVRERLVRLASEDPSPVVRRQLACTARRLPADDALAIVAQLFHLDEDAVDTHMPLLIWWAIEDKAIAHADDVLALLSDKNTWQLPLVRDTLIERLTRRYAAERNDAGYDACARLLTLAPTGKEVERIVTAMESEFTGTRLTAVPAPLAEPLAKLWRANPNDPTITRLALRLGMSDAYEAAVARMNDSNVPQPFRLSYISTIGQAGDATVVTRLLPLLEKSHDEAIRSSALAALAHFDNEQIAAAILSHYEDFSPALRPRAVTLLASRPAWATALVSAVATKKGVPAADVSVDHLRQMLAHNDSKLAQALETHWGKIRPATPGEKMAYVPVLGRVLAAGVGDRAVGHALFTKHCATCHTLFGEGAKVGPDLTSADRKNRDVLLLNILDPSGYVRPEFVAQTAVLADGRVLTGLIVESSAQEITLVDAKNQKTTIPRGDVEEIQPSEQSLMPERLLEVLQPQEVRDLFAYLQGEGPAPADASGGE